MLSPINSYLRALKEIQFRSSLLDNLYLSAFAISLFLDAITVSYLLYLSYILPFVCVIGVVLVFSFLCNRFILSQGNVTFWNAFFFTLVCVIFSLSLNHLTSIATLIKHKYISALSSTIIEDHFSFYVRLNCLLSYSGNLLTLHLAHFMSRKKFLTLFPLWEMVKFVDWIKNSFYICFTSYPFYKLAILFGIFCNNCFWLTTWVAIKFL